VSFLARAKEFIQQRSENGGEVVRARVVREKEIFSVPSEKLEKVEWTRALEAAYLHLLQCGKQPDSELLDAVAALLLFLSDPTENTENTEKVEKPTVHYGLTRAGAEALLIRVCLGQRIRLGDDGLIEEVASEESAAA